MNWLKIRVHYDDRPNKWLVVVFIGLLDGVYVVYMSMTIMSTSSITTMTYESLRILRLFVTNPMNGRCNNYNFEKTLSKNVFC